MNLKKILTFLKHVLLLLVGALLLILVLIFLWFCLFNSVSSNPKGPAAEPSLENFDKASWENQKEELRQQFTDEIYGPYPTQSDKLIEVKRETLHDKSLDKIAHIQQITYKSASVETLNVILILPKDTTTPVPVIIGQNFASNPTTFPFKGVHAPATPFTSMGGEPGASSGILIKLVKLIMGEHLITPPLEDIINAGYGFAGFYPGELVPDNSHLAPAYLEKFKSDQGKTATGAISVWAWGFNRVAEALSTNPKIDGTRIALFGHSRHAKAALLATAFEETANLVISHQSGTGGASLGKTGIGESIQSINDQYPHWFTPGYNKENLTVDAHQLIALAAPTPIILGNGQHDKWSDPQTAFRAIEGATPIYNLYGVEGLDQTKLTKPNTKTNLSFHMRRGPHGTRGSDWKAFLEFLDYHFQ